MARLTWDQPTEHFYETGIKQGVLYPYATNGYGEGVAWNGLTAVTEQPSGAEETKLYADDDKYLSLRSAEEFGLTIEAYTYPDEFMECDGSASAMSGMVIGQQSRKMFGLCYRTAIGNDVDGNDHAFKLHLVYGITVAPSERAYSTINDSPEAITFSWEGSCTPVDVNITGKDFKKTCIITIDSRKFTETAAKAKLNALIDILYGTDPVEQSEGTAPSLPSPALVYSTLSAS